MGGPGRQGGVWCLGQIQKSTRYFLKQQQWYSQGGLAVAKSFEKYQIKWDNNICWRTRKDQISNQVRQQHFLSENMSYYLRALNMIDKILIPSTHSHTHHVNL